MTTTSCRPAAGKKKGGPSRSQDRPPHDTGSNSTPQAIRKHQTTLGFSLFADPIHGPATVSEIRQRLELKFCACLATGGHHGWPLGVDQIRDTRLRSLAGAGMACKDWTVADLIACSGNLEGHATSVLLASLDGPEWGPHDLILMDLIERVESMRNMALGGGRLL